MKVLDYIGLQYLWSKLKTLLSGKQDKLVSGTSIKTINSTSLLGSGDISIEPIGFDSVSSQQDGTMDITLTNGDVITVDLNHTHPQYKPIVYLTDESQMPASPDADTLYVILESS